MAAEKVFSLFVHPFEVLFKMGEIKRGAVKGENRAYSFVFGVRYWQGRAQLCKIFIHMFVEPG
ncbi:MAG: hypothetical protein ACKVJQ_03825 [Alphaproteobacteria bacterium]|jgi:hypothetical protein